MRDAPRLATWIAKAPYAKGFGLPSVLREFPVLAVWKALAYAGSGWAVARLAPAAGPSIAFTYTAFVVGADAILFAQQFAHYSIAQLVTDLLILYPLATLLGGLAAARNRSIQGVGL